jgi:PAS domain S-box-containing protein
MFHLARPKMSTRRRLLIYVVLPVAYIICGRLGVFLAVPPGYATANFLPAGIAVAAMLMAGVVTLPATFVGSLLLNIWIGYSSGDPAGYVSAAAALVVALASMLQAATGGTLLRRAIGYPAALDNPRDLLIFLTFSPIFCLTSPSLSVTGLWMLGTVPSADFLSNWMTWWVGDTLGVLVALPLMLVVAGEPRGLWRLRVWHVAVPMTLCFALLIAVFARVGGWGQSLEPTPSASYLAQQHWESFIVLGGGVFITGLLGALLMLSTGHTYRTHIREEELKAVLHQTPFMLTRCSKDKRYRFVSESYAAMLGLRPEEMVGKPIGEIVGQKALRVMTPYIERVLQGERVEYENEIGYQGIGVRSVHVVCTPDRSEHGETVGWIASILDVTDQKQAQQRERTLLLEVQHRNNNLLAVVQTIAHRSLVSGQSMDEARKAFESRLQALARTNRQLTKSNWQGVDLREIVRLEMEPFGGRSTIDGINVVLDPKEAQNFSLALHELATNAAKYGALSKGAGNVGISWAITTNGKREILKFRWRERGGPPVSKPIQEGFGSALLKATFPSTNLHYALTGLNCEIELALPGPVVAAADQVIV